MNKIYKRYHIHIVFGTKYRRKLIREDIRERVQQYICGILREFNVKVIAIYCMPDHLHILVDMNPKYALSEVVRVLKCNSAKWLNRMKLTRTTFKWQEGYGAFACSKNDLPRAIEYINNQKEHHRLESFKEKNGDFAQEWEI